MSVCGLTRNQVRTTRVVSKCQKRWSDCFDAILLYFEKKTEQSNSEFWRRCFVQNLRLLSISQFEHGWITWLAKKEENLRRDSSSVWIHTLLIPSYTFEQFKDTLAGNTSILQCKFAEHINHVGSSHDTHSIIQCGLIPVAKTSRKGDMRCSVQLWIQCTSFIIEWRITTWRSQGLQCIGRIAVLSKAITFYNTLLAICIEKVVVLKNYTAMRISLPLHRRELYWSRTWIMKARTPQASTRESLSIILTSTRTWQLVAVRQTSESKDCLTQLSKNTITSANRRSRNWFTSSRTTRTKKHYKQTCNRIARSIHSASSRRKCTAAWEIWSTSRFARALPTLYAPTVWHVGRQVLYTAQAEHA